MCNPPRIETKDIQTWSLEEANQFLQHTENERLHIAYVLAIYTGMRRGEILGLRWRDCDLEQAKVSIRQTLARVDGKLVFQEPKTKGSKRRITITEEVISALKKHRSEQNKYKLLLGPGYIDNDLIVCTEDGKPIDPRNLLRHFARMKKETNVPELRFHDLRHTHATILLLLSENPKVVSERLGHSRVDITLDIYSHVLPDMQENAANNFEQAMKQKKNDATH
ncbi:site-specific integrase [Bacillus cereus]|uniref:site-specific integrase n=1 Tax=Bacillus TaxID=1386 RepID=UPI003012BD1D